MSDREVLDLKDRISVSDGNKFTKDKLMQAIEVRLSGNARASQALLEYSESNGELD